MALVARPYLQSVSLKDGVPVDFDAYPFNIPAVRELDRIAWHPDVTFLVGENGTGKSTILEAIALALGYSPQGGTRNFRVSNAATESSLHAALRIVKSYKAPRDGFFLRAESFYNVASYLDDVGLPLKGYGERSLHRQSHGESFMSLLTNRFGHGLYLLDEPEAALSLNRQLAALRAIDNLVRAESQFIIATHSPILLSYPNARIVVFDATGVSETRYEDTEHYAVTRDFLNHYPRRLEQLFADDA